ncbi:MAG: TonB-dependent receptor [Agarilytica sp.]
MSIHKKITRLHQFHSHSRRFVLALGLSVSAILTGTLPNLASAATIEEVIVTAQKREENIQSVGLSIQALSRKEIEARAMTQASDILEQMANVGRNAANGINAGFTIRGVGTNNFHGNVARAVSVSQDEVSYNNPYIGAMSVFDLERIEVVRGPQNTLFGRNAIGGAISYITEKPVIGKDAHGYLNIHTGNYGFRRAEGAVGFKVGTKTAGRFAATSFQRDGLFDNILDTSGENSLGEKDQNAARFQLLVEPNETSSFLVKLHSGSQGGTAVSNKAIGLRDPDDPSSDCDTQTLSAGSDFRRRTNCVTSTGFNPSSDDWHSLADVSPASQDVDFGGASLTATFNFNAFELASITSLETTEVRFSEDLGAEDQLRMIAYQDSEFEQLSQEWRLTSLSDGNIRWIAGIYLFDENMRQNTNVRRVLIANSLPITAYNKLKQDEHDYSAYLQLDFEFTDSTTLTTGLRYTDNKKAADSLFGVVRTTEVDFSADTFIDEAIVTELTGTTPGQCPPPVGGIPCTMDLGRIYQNSEETGFNMRLSHRYNDNTLIYGSIAEGFKSGGFDTRALAAFAGTADEPVKPEYLSALELGIKSTFYESITLNSAVFYYDWDDLQTFDTVAGVPAFLNIPNVKIKGAEFELSWQSPSKLRLAANAGFLNSEITNSGDLAGVDEGHELLNTPSQSYTALIEKTFSTRIGKWQLRSDAHYVGDQVDSLREENDPFTHKDAQLYWNAFISFHPTQQASQKYSWKISAWGKNLTEEKTCHQIATLTTPGTAAPSNNTTTLVCNPSDGVRQLGITANLSF